MSLIDSTYFIGTINIPNVADTAIGERLTWFINKYEPELLRDVLGYELYKSFIAGLQAVTVDQIWLDLLYGSDFIFNGRTNRYRGLIIVDDAINPGVFYPPDINFTADSTNQSSGEYHLAYLTGKTYRVVQRGVGPLEETAEIVFLSDGFSKVGGFQAGEKYTLEFLQPTPLPASSDIIAGEVKQSMIANYVYWKWIKDQVSQTTGLGEAATQAQNAMLVSPTTKMVTAWNEMARMVSELYWFLQANAEVYTDWNYQGMLGLRSYASQVNQFGI